MSEPELKVGDKVIYFDVDLSQWGPWEVIEVSGAEVTLKIEERFRYQVKASLLKKLESE